MEEVEKMIKENKKKRIIDLIWCWIAGFMILFAIWFIVSYAQVLLHNNAYYTSGTITEYPWWNLFKLIFG